MEVAASHAHSSGAIVDFIADYRKMIECDGIAVWSDGHITLSGETPTEAEVLDLIAFINRTTPGRICASAEIAKVYAAGESFRDRAAGFLAIPISRTPRDCLIFFRREILRSVKWAGDPNKAYTSGPLGPRLTPRKSFELWQEIVRGQSAPWSAADLRIAEGLRVTLARSHPAACRSGRTRAPCRAGTPGADDRGTQSPRPQHPEPGARAGNAEQRYGHESRRVRQRVGWPNSGAGARA